MANSPTSFETTSGPLFPGPDALTFGNVAFTSEECPSHLPIGCGEQITSVSELVGGGRVVATFGAQPQPVTFSGTFWNVNILPRVTLLRSYHVSGSEQLLTWNNESYYGILKKFTKDDKDSNRCPYELTIEITKDANGAFSNASPTSVDNQVGALNTAATGYYNTLLSDDSDTAAWGGNWDGLQSALQQASPLSQASPAAATSIANTITSLSSQVKSYVSTLSQIDPKIVPATQFLNALTLISKNVIQGQAPRTVDVSGDTLTTVALKYYGDVSLGMAIAQANGLSRVKLAAGVLKNIILPSFPVVA
jgi:hypothetical protein